MRFRAAKTFAALSDRIGAVSCGCSPGCFFVGFLQCGGSCPRSGFLLHLLTRRAGRKGSSSMLEVLEGRFKKLFRVL